MRRSVCAGLLALFLPAAPAAALGVQIKDVRAADAVIRATVDVRDLIPDRFTRVIDAGSVVHVRVQAELWQSRPVWDRLVYPAVTRIFRVGRSGRAVTITDAAGSTVTYPAIPNPLPVVVDLGDRGRIAVAERYYLHVVAIVGTIADREVDEAGDAVFGRDSESNTLGSFGRLVFRAALKVGDYMQSVTAEARTKRAAGAEILNRQVP